jgi:hypothetical protein
MVISSKAKETAAVESNCLIDGCLNFVCASAFAPCCPSGSGYSQNIKYYYYNKDKNNRTNYFEKFFIM